MKEPLLQAASERHDQREQKYKRSGGTTMRARQVRKAGIAGSAFAALMLVIGGTATADVKYDYTGRNFDSFSNPTSYTTGDRVTATVRLTSPLPPNLVLQDIRGLPGFSLTMSDGHQTLTPTSSGSVEALVSTDGSGNIVGPWSVFINCCSYPNNGVATLNYPNVRGVGDLGTLSYPNGTYPNTPIDQAIKYTSPGIWSDAALVPPNPVTWEIKGHITGETGASIRPFFQSAVVGDPFRVLVTFDLNARLVSTDTGGVFAPGMRYRHDPTSMAVSITVGAEGPVELSYAAMPSANDLLYMMDNSGFASSGVPWDGIFFGLNYPAFTFTLGMRGSILDIIRGPGLPSTPDPRLVNLEQRFFQMAPITGGTGSIRGQIESAGVFVADTDGDGIADTVDNCPALKNPNQKDRDGDGKGDVCDADLDGDGVPNSIDNCPAIANASQVDSNGDGYGDACVSPLTTIPKKAYVDPTAQIGPNVTINQGAIISGDVVIGAGTVVGRDVVIQAGASIGANVRLDQGVLIAGGVVIRSNVIVGRDTALCSRVVVGSGSTIGSQALIGATQVLADGSKLASGFRLVGAADDSFAACALVGPGNLVQFQGSSRTKKAQVSSTAITYSRYPPVRDDDQDKIQVNVTDNYEPWQLSPTVIDAISNVATTASIARVEVDNYSEFRPNEIYLRVRSENALIVDRSGESSPGGYFQGYGETRGSGRAVLTTRLVIPGSITRGAHLRGHLLCLEGMDPAPHATLTLTSVASGSQIIGVQPIERCSDTPQEFDMTVSLPPGSYDLSVQATTDSKAATDGPADVAGVENHAIRGVEATLQVLSSPSP